MKKMYILLLLLLPSLGFSQAKKKLTYSMIMQLDIVPVSEKNYAGQECCFELKIPYTKADSVQTMIPDLPNGVSFVSLRRSDYSDEEIGTKIELWLNFSEPGTYKLRMMRVIINGTVYNIPFVPIKILENPRDMLPQLVVAFDNGKEFVQQKRSKAQTKAFFSCEEGTPLEFTVYLQYAVQLVSFYWDVPKDSIFTEVERFDITQGLLRSSEFSEEKIPVATFEWLPLVKGNMDLPYMSLVATSYNGSRVELTLPDAFINVTPKTEEVSMDFVSLPSKYFSRAFEKSSAPEKTQVRDLVSKSDCEKISLLRSAEKRSLPFGKAFEERKAFEESLGLKGEEGEKSYFTLFAFLILAGLSLFALIIASVFKRISGIILTSTTLLAFLSLSFVNFVGLKEKTAVFAGGKISPVPEKTSEAVESIPSGKKVQIEEKAGSWYYVRYGNAGGWTDESSVILID